LSIKSVYISAAMLFSQRPSLVAFLLASLASAVSIPPLAHKTIQNVEVIPGRGLPSLASLNLTSADLFNANYKPGD
jgi:hypothetical protein